MIIKIGWDGAPVLQCWTRGPFGGLRVHLSISAAPRWLYASLPESLLVCIAQSLSCMFPHSLGYHCVTLNCLVWLYQNIFFKLSESYIPFLSQKAHIYRLLSLCVRFQGLLGPLKPLGSMECVCQGCLLRCTPIFLCSLSWRHQPTLAKEKQEQTVGEDISQLRE